MCQELKNRFVMFLCYQGKYKLKVEVVVHKKRNGVSFIFIN